MIVLVQPDNLIDFPQQPKSQEWYTPKRFADAAHAVMGEIELDPASCAKANQIIRAKRFYSKEQDGLQQPWVAASVWINPPFGKGYGSLDAWIGKLVSGYENGDIEEAIALVPSSVHTPWFQSLLHYIICFTARRIRFIRPEEKQCQSNLYGNILAYLGKNEQKFIEVFGQFGPISKCVSVPKVQVINLSLWEGDA